jgi:hypothetical protein
VHGATCRSRLVGALSLSLVGPPLPAQRGLLPIYSVGADTTSSTPADEPTSRWRDSGYSPIRRPLLFETRRADDVISMTHAAGRRVMPGIPDNPFRAARPICRSTFIRAMYRKDRRRQYVYAIDVVAPLIKVLHAQGAAAVRQSKTSLGNHCSAAPEAVCWPTRLLQFTAHRLRHARHGSRL